MALIGTIYKRKITRGKRKGKTVIDVRILAPRRPKEPVGTSRNQGYLRRRPALVPLAHLLNNVHDVYDIDGTLVPRPSSYPPDSMTFLGWKLPTRPYTGRVVPGADGKFEWEVRSRNGNLVFSSHEQGYNRAGRVKADGSVPKGTALATLVELCHGTDHTIDENLRDG